jgi:uncharacterized protein (DUF486 family)
MTFAWYAHLKNPVRQTLVDGRTVQLGYCTVRISSPGASEPHRLHRIIATPLKVMQEAMTLAVFVPFAILCIMGAVYFVFRG